MRSLRVSALIGTLLVVINQGDVLIGGGDIAWLKLVLTYIVPYGVATYAGARAKQEQSVLLVSGEHPDGV